MEREIMRPVTSMRKKGSAKFGGCNGNVFGNIGKVESGKV